MNRSILTLSLLTTTALSTPAWAEITPQEVWEDLKSFMQANGYTVTGTESPSGGALAVTDVVMTNVAPDAQDALTVELGTITLTDTGEAVSIGFEETMPIVVNTVSDSGNPVEATLEYSMTALDMQAEGTPEAVRYAYTADAVALDLQQLMVGEDEKTPDDARFSVTLSGIAGSSLSEVSDTRSRAQDLQIDAVDYDVYYAEVGSVRSEVRGNMVNVTLDSDITMPLEADSADMEDPFAQGVLARALFTHQGNTVNTQGNATTYRATSAAGSVSVELTDIGIGYGIASQDLEMEFASPDVPFPLNATAEESAMKVSVPVVPTETAQDYAFELDLLGIELDEAIWQLFDPGEALPRDPATLQIALGGKMRQTVNLFDDSALVAVDEGDQLAEVETLDVRDLTFGAAGALLTGSGSFTMDNEGEMRGRFPEPYGEITFELAGANALIDRLVGMGLLPQEQAMGARMMMSMFARPAGDDLLTSTIEIKRNGQILANGQRLQ
jgi:hypothetical protein